MSTPETDDHAGRLPGARRVSELLMRGRNAPRFLVAVTLVGLVLAVAAWRHFAVRETTDDAQIEGHVVPVAARVGGTVAAVEVADNQRVEAGAVLVRIDPRDYAIAVQRAEADLADAQAALAAALSGVPITAATTKSQVTTASASVERATAGLAAAEARLAAAEAGLREAKANDTRAQRDLERMTKLVSKDEVSHQQHDSAVAAAAAAAAALDSARAAVSEAQQGRQNAQGAVAQAQAEQAAAGTAPQQVEVTRLRAASAQARVDMAKAALEQARLNLGYATITAPARGVVSRKSVEVGQVVQPAQPLLALVSLDDVWVVANFKETQLRRMSPGQAATVYVDTYGRSYAGRVESIAAATGARFSLLPPENASGNFVKVVQRVPVKITFDQGQDPEHLLRPGMSVVPTVLTR